MTTTSIQLRDYQEQAIEATREAYRKGHRRVLVVLPTGMGKTIVLADIARRVIERGKRVLVIAHRKELIDQAARKLMQVTGLEPDIEMGESRAGEGTFGKASIVVGSIQTLSKIRKRTGRMRCEKFNPAEFGMVIVDESHHGAAATYRRVINYFGKGGSYLLGVTATPLRGDGIGLHNVFETCAFDLSIGHAVRQGWLVRPIAKSIYVQGLDFSKIKAPGKRDLTAGEVSQILERNENLYKMVAATHEECRGRRTLIFTPTKMHATMVAQKLNDYEPHSAAVVTDDTPPDARADLFSRYADGEYQYLVNVGIATEGWDDPATDGKGVQAVVIMRPTKSIALLTQMAGRGTRPLPGVVDGPETPEERIAAINASAKRDFLFLDFYGHDRTHRLARIEDVLAGDDIPDDHPMREAILDRANEEATKDDGETRDPLEQLEKARRELEAEYEAAKQRHLTPKAIYTTQGYDPFDISDILAAPLPPQEMDFWMPASDKQKEFLRKRGVDEEILENLDAKRAKQMVKRMVGFATPKMLSMIRRFGIQVPQKLPMGPGGKLIEAIKDMGFKRPPQSVINDILRNVPQENA